MGYVLSIFLNALQTWLYTKLWDSFFIRRFSGRKFWSYWLLWTAITTVIINVLPYDYDYINILRFLIEIALDYVMSLTLYRSRWDRRLFVVITGYSCFFSIAALTERALLFYSGMTQAEYVYNKPLYTAFLFLRWLCIVAFVMLIRRFHTPPPESGKPRAWIPALTLFPLCTLFVLYQVYDAGSAAGENNAWMFCLLVMCAVDMVALFLLDQLESTAQMREALAVAHQRAEVQSANVKALGNSYTAQRKMTHEFRGYLFALYQKISLAAVMQRKTTRFRVCTNDRKRFIIKEKRLWNSSTLLSKFFRLWLSLWVPVSACGVPSTCWKVTVTTTPAPSLRA